MGRTPCCNHEELKKGAWTVEEDQKLITHIQKHGTGSWRTLPQKAGLQRCGKSCRLRWFNYLRPDIKRGQLSEEEEQTIFRLHAALGNRWSSIAKHLPMRTDNEIKNCWNSYLKKHLEIKGVDPMSPKPISTISSSSNSELTTITKSNTTKVSQPTLRQSQQSPSKSESSSTQLLNKVARKIVTSGYLDTVKSWQPVGGSSNNNDVVTKSEIGSQSSNITRQSHGPNFSSMSSQSSTSSAQLLNKMATSISQKVHGHEAARAVFSKLMESGKKGEASDGSISGSDQVGGYCLAGLSHFEDGPQSSPRLLFNEIATPPCFSDNEDNWLGISSNYSTISFGNCAANGGGSSLSEVNLVSSGSCCIESPNYSTSCFLDENQSADYLNEIFTCEDEIRKYIQYL